MENGSTAKNKLLLSISLFYGMLLFGINFAMVGPILIEVSSNIDTRLEVMGYYFSLVSAGFIAGSFISSFFVRLKKRKIIFVIFYLLLPASILLLAFAGNFPVLLVSAFFLGLANGLLETNITVLLTELYKGRESLIINISQSFIGFGSFISPLVIAYLLGNGQSIQTAFLIIVCFSFINFILLIFIKIPESKTQIQVKNPDVPGNEIKNKKDFPGQKPVLKTIPAMLTAIFAAMFFYVCFESGVNSWVPTFLRINKNFTAVFAGNVMAFFWLTVAAGRLIMGWLSMKFRISYLLLAASILNTIAFKLSIIFENQIVIIILFIISGLMFAGLWPMIVAQSVNIYPKKSKVIMPLIIMTGGIGAIFSPWVIGMVYDNYSLSAGIEVIFIFAVIMTIFISGSVFLEIFFNRHKLKNP